MAAAIKMQSVARTSLTVSSDSRISAGSDAHEETVLVLAEPVPAPAFACRCRWHRSLLVVGGGSVVLAAAAAIGQFGLDEGDLYCPDDSSTCDSIQSDLTASTNGCVVTQCSPDGVFINCPAVDVLGVDTLNVTAQARPCGGNTSAAMTLLISDTLLDFSFNQTFAANVDVPAATGSHSPAACQITLTRPAGGPNSTAAQPHHEQHGRRRQVPVPIPGLSLDLPIPGFGLGAVAQAREGSSALHTALRDRCSRLKHIAWW